MKRLLIILAVAALAFGCSNKSHHQRRGMEPMELAQNFRFAPNSMRVMPAGRNKSVSSARYETIVSDQGWVRVRMPFIIATVPPFRRTTLNYTLSNVSNRTVQQTNTGWIVSFQTGLYTANRYTFTFTYFAATGNGTLDISSRLTSTVHYRGRIMPAR